MPSLPVPPLTRPLLCAETSADPAACARATCQSCATSAAPTSTRRSSLLRPFRGVRPATLYLVCVCARISFRVFEYARVRVGVAAAAARQEHVRGGNCAACPSPGRPAPGRPGQRRRTRGASPATESAAQPKGSFGLGAAAAGRAAAGRGRWATSAGSCSATRTSGAGTRPTSSDPACRDPPGRAGPGPAPRISRRPRPVWPADDGDGFPSTTRPTPPLRSPPPSVSPGRVEQRGCDGPAGGGGGGGGSESESRGSALNVAVLSPIRHVF